MAVLGLLVHLLYRQIATAPSWSTWLAKTHHWEYLLLALLLLPINWWLEVHKWRRLLLANGHALASSTAWNAVMAGVSLGLITPQRIGLYGGRALLLPKRLRGPGVLTSVVSNLAQLLVITGAGLLGITYLAEPLFSGHFTETWPLYTGVGIVLLLMVVSWFWAAQSLPFWPAWLARIGWSLPASWSKRWSHIPTRGWGEVVVWSTLRYLVYSGQFVLLLRALCPSIPLSSAMAGVSSLFLVQTGLPLPPVLGLTARNEIALLLWSDYGLDTIGILLATTGLFILNMSLPALWGGALILTKNLLKNEKTENIPAA